MTLRAYLIAVAALLTLTMSVARADTFAHVDGTQSAAIGGNIDYRTNDVTATVRLVNGVPNEVRIVAGDYRLTFAAPTDMPELTPGNYELASRLFSRATLPYISLSRHIGCNALLGRFVIREFSVDANDAVSSLAVDFSAECFDLGGGEVLLGQIRLDSDVAEILPQPTAAAGVDRNVDENRVVKVDAGESMPGATPIRSYRWRQLSGPAASIYQPEIAATAVILPEVPPGGGVIELEVTVTNEAGNSDVDTVSFNVSDSADRRTRLYLATTREVLPLGRESAFADDLGRISATALENENAKRIRVRYEGLESMAFDFFVPIDAELAPGFFPDAARSPFHSPKRPAQSIAQLCEFLNEPGWFHIRELTLDPDGNVESLAVDFFEHCVSLTDLPVKKGGVRINSSVPMVGELPTAAANIDRTTFSGATVTLDGSYSTAAGDIMRTPLQHIESYAWAQTGGPPVFLERADGAVAHFTAPAVQTEQVLTFELSVIDSESGEASSSTSVVVRPTDAPRDLFIVTGQPGHFVLLGRSLVFNSDRAEMSMMTSVAQRLLTTFRADDSWTLLLQTTDGSPLTTGMYSGDDVISFSGQGRGCNVEGGNFDLARYDQDAAGEVTALAVTFEHICGEAGGTDNRAIGRFYIDQVVPGLPPVADAGPDIRVPEGETFTLTGAASSDPDGEIVSYHWRQLSGRSHGLGNIGFDHRQPVVANIVARTIDPRFDEALLTFELAVSDELGFTSTDIVDVIVERTTVAPVALDDTYATDVDTAIDIDVTANDISGSASFENMSILGQPFFGTLTFTGTTTLRYVPDDGFVGDDTFAYVVIDGNDNFSEPALATISVQKPPSPPPPPPPSSGGGDSGGGAALWLLLVALAKYPGRLVADQSTACRVKKIAFAGGAIDQNRR